MLFNKGRSYYFSFGSLTFGTYMKIFFIASIGYAVLNELFVVGRMIWVYHSESGAFQTLSAYGDGTGAWLIFKVMGLALLLSPLECIAGTMIAALMGYPLYRLICKKRGGLFMKGNIVEMIPTSPFPGNKASQV